MYGRLLPAVVFAALLAFVLPVSAQVPGYPNGCTNCGIASFIDFPVSGERSQDGFYIAGWGFECGSGMPANRVDVYYQGDDGFFKPAGGAGSNGNGSLHYGLRRPDVRAVYQPYCPTLTDRSGWHFYFNAPVPHGTRAFVVNVWYGPYMQQHKLTLTIE